MYYSLPPRTPVKGTTGTGPELDGSFAHVRGEKKTGFVDVTVTENRF